MDDNEQLDDLLGTYIDTNFQQELIPVIASSFQILERFQVPYYEDRFVDLLCVNDLVEKDDLRSLFLNHLNSALLGILDEHGVTLDREMEPTLMEINEVLFFLLLCQDLEDTSQLSYRLSGFGAPRTKFIDLLVYYSALSQIRAMELVESVSESLIAAMLAICSDNQATREIDKIHHRYWTDFQEFAGKTQCLGLALKHKGFFGLTLKETIALSSTDLAGHIESTMLTSPPQAALDLLSVLLLCKDTYQTPLVYMEANSHVYSSQLETVTKIKALVSHMLGDFSNLLQARKTQVQ